MGDAVQISTSVTILNSLLGYQGISLTEYTTSAISAIAAGSKVELASSFFRWESQQTINASSWTAITTATTAYLALTPSGSAGSQILSAAWTATPPTWSESKQGWYTAGDAARVVGSCYKLGATSQGAKAIYSKGQDTIFTFNVLTGTWNMNSVDTFSFITPVPFTKIKSIVAMINRDAQDSINDFRDYYNGYCGGRIDVGATIYLIRYASGLFTTADYDGTTYNRGVISITYDAL